MIKSISRRAVIMTAAMSPLAAPHIARAAPRIIKLGHNAVDDSQFGAGSIAFAAAVAADPDLATVVKIEIHGHAEFGDEAAMLKDCMAGTIDMAAGVSATAGPYCSEIGILDVPFVFRDVDRGRAAFDGAIGEEYADLLKTKSIHVVSWMENGLRQLTANRAVRQPSDMQGLKLRVLPSQVAVDSFRALGADAGQLPYNQLFEALRTGQFEAQENPIASIESSKFFQVQKFLCLTGHIYSVGFLVASPDVMEDLTPKQQAALRNCGKAATRASRDVAGTAARDGIARLRASGMTIVEDVDTAAFVAANRPNLDRIGERFGADRVARMVKAAA